MTIEQAAVPATRNVVHIKALQDASRHLQVLARDAAHGRYLVESARDSGLHYEVALYRAVAGPAPAAGQTLQACAGGAARIYAGAAPSGDAGCGAASTARCCRAAAVCHHARAAAARACVPAATPICGRGIVSATGAGVAMFARQGVRLISEQRAGRTTLRCYGIRAARGGCQYRCALNRSWLRTSLRRSLYIAGNSARRRLRARKSSLPAHRVGIGGSGGRCGAWDGCQNNIRVRSICCGW